MNLTKVCNDGGTTGESPCLKCADLAIVLGGNGPQVTASEGLIGRTAEPGENIFTTCEKVRLSGEVDSQI